MRSYIPFILKDFRPEKPAYGRGERKKTWEVEN